MLQENSEFTAIKTTIILFILMAIMVWARVVPVYDSVITNWPGIAGYYINFAADDAVYHMRLVHNTIAHFPYRILYDPFTNFPYGSHIHFGPLFTLIIAGIALIVGKGHPSISLVNYVSAFVPVFMGALCILPTYFIAKKLFGRDCGILAATVLTFLPGSFLVRSCLGYVDHHIAEVLFSTTTLAFLIYALSAIDNKKVFYRNTILAGIFNGLFFLIWPGAFLFTAIFMLYLIVQLLLDYYAAKPLNYLLVLTSAIFIIPIILLSPYAIINPKLEYLSTIKLTYSLIMPVLLFIGFLFLTAIFAIAKICVRYKVNFLKFILSFVIFNLLLVLACYLVVPKIFITIVGGVKVLLSPSIYMRSISEDWPILINRATNKIFFAELFANFYYVLPFAVLGILQLFYRVITKKNRAETLLLITIILIAVAMLEQQRFAYYFAIYVAIAAGLFFYTIINYIVKNTPKTKMQLLLVLPLGILWGFFIIFPFTPFSPYYYIKLAPGMDKEFYDSLYWLRTHTPDPQGKIINKDFDFANGIYQEPIKADGKFNYPPSAYSIISWWDYGHDIIFAAARIPVANPFQEGIISKDKSSGVAPFLLATSENSALKNLDQLRGKYIFITNAMLLSQFNLIMLWAGDMQGFAKPQAIRVNPANNKAVKIMVDTDKAKSTMLYRMYYLDADQLQHFRLVYESLGAYQMQAAIIYPKKNLLTVTTLPSNDLNEIKKLKEKARVPFGFAINVPDNDNKDKNKKSFTKAYIYLLRTPAKNYKIFEKVNGALITGTAPKDAKVKLQLQLISNAKRAFVYEQTTKALNGRYKFTVPYPTDRMQGDGYSYDVHAISPYIISVNGKIIAKVKIKEKNILK